MAETKQIPTITSVTSQGNEIVVFTRYLEDELPNTIDAQILNLATTQDGTLGQQGELLMQLKNFPEKINYTINNMGELIVFSTTGDVDNYSINNNGNLIYEF